MQAVLEKVKPWFEEWFDSSYYHTLYCERNDDEAGRFMNILLTALKPTPGSNMLDLGCGAGRHSFHLANYGYNVTGLDLSLNSIVQAKKLSCSNLKFTHADMRDPFGVCEYDYILSLFTSFGYFDNHENSKVARNMTRALKPGGTLVIDYLNTHTVLNKIVPFEVIEKDNIHFFIARWFDANFIYKRIAISDLEKTPEIIFTERVNLFSLEDFVEMFSQFGLRLKATYGDYQMKTYNPDESKRLILVFTK
jgi:SAM-dependent methyltransferase